MNEHQQNNIKGSDLIVKLLVANSLNVDIKTALKKKMEKINTRYH